jgi:hypothetical protein
LRWDRRRTGHRQHRPRLGDSAPRGSGRGWCSCRSPRLRLRLQTRARFSSGCSPSRDSTERGSRLGARTLSKRGVLSSAYRPGPYSPSRESNVIAFVDWYLDALHST